MQSPRIPPQFATNQIIGILSFFVILVTTGGLIYTLISARFCLAYLYISEINVSSDEFFVLFTMSCNSLNMLKLSTILWQCLSLLFSPNMARSFSFARRREQSGGYSLFKFITFQRFLQDFFNFLAFYKIFNPHPIVPWPKSQG